MVAMEETGRKGGAPREGSLSAFKILSVVPIDPPLPLVSPHKHSKLVRVTSMLTPQRKKNKFVFDTTWAARARGCHQPLHGLIALALLQTRGLVLKALLRCFCCATVVRSAHNVYSASCRLSYSSQQTSSACLPLHYMQKSFSLPLP